MNRVVGVADTAANNAAWCELVCRTHGIVGVAAADAWTAPVRTPQWYPDAVTLRPDVSAPALLSRIDAGPGASVKDSFARLELGPHGFDVLFEATWIGRGPRPGVLRGETHAFAAVDASGFDAWTTAWSGEAGGVDILRPALLDDARVTALAAGDDGHVQAGAVLFASAEGIGVTNVFGPHRDHDAVWRGIVAWAEMHAPGTTLVGYETGADLAAARRCGFQELGALRVWARA